MHMNVVCEPADKGVFTPCERKRAALVQLMRHVRMTYARYTFIPSDFRRFSFFTTFVITTLSYR